jgi:hypothetical protein
MEAMEISLPWCLGPVIKGHENSLVASYDLDVIITAEVRISRYEFDRGRSTIRCGGEIHAVKANEKQKLHPRDRPRYSNEFYAAPVILGSSQFNGLFRLAKWTSRFQLALQFLRLCYVEVHWQETINYDTV